ncbi:Sec-independent protein translocase protein TatB [Rhodococcus sp. NPDC127528]|uniref:Sec-independent protein translocase protein TatB n=1 Tax=unclassified Rhodococcus (in: high G+C Gram-positive bacteria) TaxID=192944 RepID=UPI00362B908B
MFSNLGWDKIVVLFVAALVVLGPERLPGALHQSLQFLRRARDYASGATEQLRDELRPALDELGRVLPQPTRNLDVAPRIVMTPDHDSEGSIADPAAPAGGAPDDRDEDV